MSEQLTYKPQELQKMDAYFEDILQSIETHLDDTQEKQIRKAYETAKEAHRHQRRKSGEAYIFHPLAVAEIVAKEMGLGPISVIAALLHDVVEDTDLTTDYIRREFGEKIAEIVHGLTKIKRLPKEKNISLQAENFRKLILTLSADVRVVLVKIADRLHNMRTMQSMPRHKQERIASETMYIYAPLAHRFGLHRIKTELEDLSLRYTDPEAYFEIKRKLAETRKEREQYIKEFTAIVEERLKKEGFEFEILGRPKSIYSIYRKMRQKNVEFEEIYDKFAIRIIYKAPLELEKRYAWNIFSIITDYFKYNSDRVRNWLDQPRSTGYQALHVTVLGPQNKWVEVQIRSERMNEIAEKGYAAHYKYKHGGKDEASELGIQKWINQLQEILNDPNEDALDFIDDIRLDLYSDEIHVFTPKGDVISLPKGATALDFAFHIHTEVGMHTRASEVNGKIVPLNYVLNNGDIVRIITSPHQHPRHSWLNIAATGRARSKIKAYLRQEENDIIEQGKEILKRKLRSLKLKYNEQTINQLQKYFKLKNSRELFYKIGSGEIGNDELKAFANVQGNIILKLLQTSWPRRDKKKKTAIPQPVEEDINYDTIVFGPDEQRLDYTLANCCNPLPGDDIFGFITINEGIKVHKKTCPNAIYLQSRYAHRIIPAVWIDSTKEKYKVKLKISGLDRPGIVADISKTVSVDLQIPLEHIEFTYLNGLFEGLIQVRLENTSELKELMMRIKQIEGVKKIEKV